MADAPVFPDFELIPADQPGLTPDEQIDSLAAALDPAQLIQPNLDTPVDRPIGRTISCDFNAIDFQLPKVYGIHPTPQWVDGIQTIVVWANTALRTQRGASPILPTWFGMTAPGRMIGKVDRAELRAEYANDARETLLQHERITDVRNMIFDYNYDDDSIFFSATLVIDNDLEVLLSEIPVL